MDLMVYQWINNGESWDDMGKYPLGMTVTVSELENGTVESSWMFFLSNNIVIFQFVMWLLTRG